MKKEVIKRPRKFDRYRIEIALSLTYTDIDRIGSQKKV